jgi:hypothetical protein
MALQNTSRGETLPAENNDSVSTDVQVKSKQNELPSWLRLCVIGILIIFAALTLVGIARTFTPVPRGDEWDGNLEFFANVSEGNWQVWFAQFWADRIVLPRLFFWADLRFFGGHFLFQLLSGLAFVIALWISFLLLARVLIKDRALRFWICATITLLSSSWMQIPNFAVAFDGVHYFAVMFFALGTFVATANAKKDQYAFYFALFAGLAAAGTRLSGLMALPLAAILAFLVGVGMVRSAVLLVLSGLVFIAYFANYIWPETSGTALAALYDPIGIVQYTLTYLGNVAFYIVFVALAGVDLAFKIVLQQQSAGLDKFVDHPVAFAAGLTAALMTGTALVMLTLVLSWRWLKSDRDPLRGSLIVLVIFVCGTAFATALGQLSVAGVEQSIAARYTTPTISALAAVAILAAPYLSARQASVLFLISTLFLLPRQLTALRSREAEHANLERAMQAVIEHRDTEQDRSVLYPGSPEIVDRVANRIRAMENPPPPWPWHR